MDIQGEQHTLLAVEDR
jgi:hypothetical protein